MERNGTVGLFLCFVAALCLLMWLGKLAYEWGGGLHVDQGQNMQDDFSRAQNWADVRR